MSLLDVLGDPAWQGAGAIVALAALLIYVRVEVIRRRRPRDAPAAPNTAPPSVRYFMITDEAGERAYYDELARYIAAAESAVYRTGRGFHRDSSADLYSALLRAEEVALANGVEMVRLQLSSTVAKGWAEEYAALLQRHPDTFRMVADVDYSGYGDIGVIDPNGRRPVVSFLFESQAPGRFGAVGRPEVAVIVTGAETLAATVSAELRARAAEYPRMTPGDVRDLARANLYFAWGVHMASHKLLRDAPDAVPRGTAILRGWERNIAAMLTGPADRATIRETGRQEDSFDGVAYELSWWDKMRLDRLEKRAYEERRVLVEIDGRSQWAFTYVPLPPATGKPEWSPGSWIALVLEGALENNMTGLLAELRQAGAPTKLDHL